MTWLIVMECLCHDWPRICSNCCKHFPVLFSFMTFTGFVTRLTRRVPLVGQELLTLPEHLSSPPVFSGVRVTRSLVLCVCFVDRCLYFFFLTIVLSVLLRYTDSDYLPLVYCGHCVVCSSAIYGFWLPPFGILWTLCCLFFCDIRILITSLWYIVDIVLSVLLRYTDSDYLPLVYCGHCVVCSSAIYGFWLPPFGILWTLCCLFFCDIRILITSLWYIVDIVLSVLLRYTDSDYLPLVYCGHCVVCSSAIYGFWLPPFGILWTLCCLFFCDIRILIALLVSSNSSQWNTIPYTEN